MKLTPTLLALSAVLLPTSLTPACGSDSETEAGDDADGIRVVSPSDAAEILDGELTQPILVDVRTPEEFNEAHLDGAILIDFYEDDFKNQISELDRDASYVIYCRSGNRSGQTREIMEGLGFTDVVDIDGGIVAWQADGLTTVS